jgi:branched-chain amino acid transport system ATP-binding protein
VNDFSARIAGAGYGRLVIVPELEISVPEGQVVVLLGSNGAGKTTSLKAIVGTVKAAQRSLTFRGEDISQLAPWQLVSRGIAFVPDGARCFAGLTVEENLLGAFRVANPSHTVKAYEARRGRVHELFPILKDRSRQLAGSLSGGQRQMLGIARALMIEPKVLILDEPSAGLAPRLVDEIFSDLRRIKESEHVSILMAEQNVAQAQKIADFCVVLAEGAVATRGAPTELFRDERLRTAYLGL